MSGRFGPKREMNPWGRESFFEPPPVSLPVVPKTGDRVLFCVFLGKSGGEIERDRGKTKYYEGVGARADKKAKIVELEQDKDSGRVLVQTSEIRSAQGSAPTFPRSVLK